MKILNVFLLLLFMLSSKLNGQMITNASTASLTAKKDLSFELYDLSGKKLKGDKLNAGEEESLNYKSGIDILNILCDDQYYTKKVLL